MRKLKHFSLLIFFSFCLVGLSAQNEEYGMASYYGDEFDGGATASGESYDKNKMTAAHKTLPMGTKVRVTRLDNKKSVVVKINDRGPYLKGRIVDLSGRAAASLDMIADGTAEVRLEVLGKGAKTTSTAKPKPSAIAKTEIPKAQVPAKPPKVAKTNKPKSSVLPKDKPKAATSEPIVITPKGNTKSSSKGKATTVAQKETIAEPSFKLVTGKDYKEYDLYKIELSRPDKKGFGVQVGVFSDYDNTLKRVAELQGMWFKNILISTEKGPKGKLYKIILGPFPDQKTATAYKNSAKKKKKLAGFVVNLENTGGK